MRPLAWSPCHRLIPSRFPTVGLFDEVAEPDELEVVYAIEALTNPRIRDQLGELRLVPPAERVAGPGATLIMAAFTHLNPLGSRFSDGSWGVYYAGDTQDTAIAEVRFHRERFLARTAEPPIDIDLRWIRAELRADAHDIRGCAAELPAVYDPEPAHYGAGQAFARALRTAGASALVYDSVRHAGGHCAAVFRPRALARAREAGHLAMHWDGQRITHWYDKGPPHALP